MRQKKERATSGAKNVTFAGRRPKMNRSDYSDTQLRVIDSENKRILVSASAGSGKTTVMIERIATLLRDKNAGSEKCWYARLQSPQHPI